MRVNFLISITHQENQSWQGSIEWLDTGKVIHFRSELELISLIAEAANADKKGSENFRNWEMSKMLYAAK